jgi:hypothetical protein
MEDILMISMLGLSMLAGICAGGMGVLVMKRS